MIQLVGAPLGVSGGLKERLENCEFWIFGMTMKRALAEAVSQLDVTLEVENGGSRACMSPVLTTSAKLERQETANQRQESYVSWSSIFSKRAMSPTHWLNNSKKVDLDPQIRRKRKGHRRKIPTSSALNKENFQGMMTPGY